MSFLALFGHQASRRRRWTPAALTGLRLWLTAGPTWCYQDAGASVPCGDGDPVYTWVDRSGTGNLVQATGAKRPTLRLDGPAWYVDFDGTADWVGRAGGHAAGSHSLYTAFRLATAANTQMIAWNGEDGIGMFTSHFTLNDRLYSAAGPGNDVDSGFATDASDHAFGLTFDGATLRTYRDGTAGLTGTPTYNPTGTTYVRVGANVAETQFAGGRVYGAVLAASVPADDVRANLDAYLAGLMPA